MSHALAREDNSRKRKKKTWTANIKMSWRKIDNYLKGENMPYMLRACPDAFRWCYCSQVRTWRGRICDCCYWWRLQQLIKIWHISSSKIILIQAHKQNHMQEQVHRCMQTTDVISLILHTYTITIAYNTYHEFEVVKKWEEQHTVVGSVSKVPHILKQLQGWCK